jgi:hypothetical protein
MPEAPDTILVTGEVFEQIEITDALITPAGGEQGYLGDFLNGGTVAQQVVATFVQQSTAAGLTATGSTYAGALQLADALNFFSTVVTGTGTVLPPISEMGIGGSAEIFNAGAGTLSVYGPNGATIDNTAGTTGVVLSNARRCEYIASTGSTYISAQLGAVSA